MRTNTHFRSYLARLYSVKEMFPTNVADKIKTHILNSIYFFKEFVPFMR